MSENRALRLLALLLAVGLFAGACGSDGESSGAQTLIGTWEFSTDAFASEMQLDDDSSYAFLGPPATQGEEVIRAGSTIDQGRYETDGDSVTFRTDDDNPVCAGATGEYLMTFDGADTLNVELVDDECGERARDLDSAQLVRISG